jgi:polysaccharide pyruvyl transferase WcaK-like protein
MPTCKKAATLRALRTTEVWLTFHKARDRAMTNVIDHIRDVLVSGADAATVVAHLRQAMFEADTDLRVAQRLHELRLQELQEIHTFPDE